MNIVLLESLGVSEEKLKSLTQRLTSAGHTFTAFPKTSDTAALIRECKTADVIIIANMKLSGDVIMSCPNLKMIDVAFTGTDHVDKTSCLKKGVIVCNAAGYATEPVAELTIAQMINLLRSVKTADIKCRNGEDKAGIVSRELGSCTVGIVGTGAIGQRVAELCSAFGAKVLGYAPHRRKEAEKLLTYVSLEELLTRSDIVTLHCPLNPSTKGMIGEKELALMKHGSYLINMARGGVVDSGALAEALNGGKLSGAAIDVFGCEPPLTSADTSDDDMKLLQAPNCIVTPHIGFYSRESMEMRADIVFDTLYRFIDGEVVRKVY